MWCYQHARPQSMCGLAHEENPVHRLSGKERSRLRRVNQLLTALTEMHSCDCECSLCEARILTDVQDEASANIEYLPSEADL